MSYTPDCADCPSPEDCKAKNDCQVMRQIRHPTPATPSPTSRNDVLLPATVYLEVNRLTAAIPNGQAKWDAIDTLHAFARFCKATFTQSESGRKVPCAKCGTEAVHAANCCCESCTGT